MTAAFTQIPKLPVPAPGRAAGLTVTVEQIDASYFSHIAGGYWDWHALFGRDPQARCTQHPDYVLTELMYSREPGACIAYFVVCRRGSEPVSAAILVPKSLVGEKRFGPSWNLVGFRLAGNRFLGPGDAECDDRLLAAVQGCMSATRADFVIVEDVVESDRLVEMMKGHPHGLRPFRPIPFQIRHTIQLPATVDEYWQKFSSKTRNTLRRKVKQFGDGRLERITQPDQVADFLAHAHEISKHSWQSELLGLRIHSDELEMHLLTLLATHQALRAYLLWKDDQPVSFCIGTQYNGVFNYEEVAFDRRWHDSSPGHVLVIRMIEDLLTHSPPHVLDFGYGDAEYKRQFGNATASSGYLWLLRPGLKSYLIENYLTGRRKFVQIARGVLARTGLLAHVKHWLRRGAGE